jgi:hypothetical protein
MMMKGMYRVALMLGLVAATAGSVEAGEIQGPGDEITTEIYVVNNHLADVRVFAEDSEGRLYNMGRVARGDLRTFAVPDDVAGTEFRIKVFPSSPVYSPVPDDYGVKTNALNGDRDHQVRLWLEADLSQSVVEIDRG